MQCTAVAIDKTRQEQHQLRDEWRRDLRADADELAEVPARDLDDAVVHGRLETGRRRAGDRVPEDGQRQTERQFGRHVGQRVAGGLTGQRRAARQPRVHLDDVVLLRERVQRVLDVALADHAEVSHHLCVNSFRKSTARSARFFIVRNRLPCQ